MRKSIVTFLSIWALALPANADFKEHYDLGHQYLMNFQYSGAITEFKSALRINYKDNSARIGLVNAYLSRGTYYANTDKNYKKAANDYRSALFYLKYYPDEQAVQNSAQGIVQATSNLNRCLNAIHFDTSAKNRFQTAKTLRADGDFAAAGYEFNQTLGDKNYLKDSFEQVGDIMRLIGNNPKAAEYYKKAVSVAPTDTDLRLVYAKTLDLLGQEQDAVNEYNFILTQDGISSGTLYSLERIYKKKLETSPNDAGITANLGAILQKQGKFDEALRFYSRAEYLDPANINTRINVGTLYQQKGDYKTAIVAYDSVLTLYPDNAQVNLYKAQALEALGDNKAAMDIYKKVLAAEPDNELANAQFMNSIRKTMSPQQFVEYAKKSKGGADYIYNYALELHKQNKLDDAIYLYTEASKLNPNEPEIFANLGIAYSQKGDLNTAKEVLDAALTKFSDNNQIKEANNSVTAQIADAQLAKAAAYYNNNDYKNAIEAYLKVQPQTFETTLAIASAYQNLGDNDNALLYYKKAFDMDKNNAEVAYYIAATYAEKNDLYNAKEYAKTALSINPLYTQAQELLENVKQTQISNWLQEGMDLYEKGDYMSANGRINWVLKEDKYNAYALYYRGLIYDVHKQYNSAIGAYRQALINNPELTMAHYLLAVDYDLTEQYKKAYDEYKTFVGLYAEDDDYKKYAQSRMEELKDYAQ